MFGSGSSMYADIKRKLQLLNFRNNFLLRHTSKKLFPMKIKLLKNRLVTKKCYARDNPFPAGDHNSHINRRAQRHSKHKTEQKHKISALERSVKYFTGGLKPVYGTNLTLNSDVDQDT